MPPQPISPFPNFPCINVKDYGAVGNGMADEHAAFSVAMDKADSANLPLYVPSGRYKVHLKLAHNGIHLIGEKNPGDALTNGTVILGLIDCNLKQNVVIEHLGIDSRGELGPADDAALNSGGVAANGILNQKFKDISLAGDGYLDYKHGILCQSGTGIELHNISVSYFYHGIAIRSSNVTIDTVYAKFCGFTSIIVKSDQGYNALTENVSINHIEIKGNPLDAYSRGGAVMVNSYAAPSITRNVTIRNVTSTTGGIACVLVQQTNGTIANISVSDCIAREQGDAATSACYDVDGGSQITFTNCTATNSTGYGFRARGSVSDVKVINSFESNSHAGAWTGSFTYLQLNGVEIIR